MSEFPQQVERLIDGMMDPAVLLDRHRSILRFNPAYQLFAGRRLRALQLAAARGLTCCDVAGLEVCDHRCVALKALELGVAVRLDEIAARPIHGGDRTLIVTAIPLDGKLVVETYRDVTADARIQRRYRTLLAAEKRAKETLEQEVAQRTAELSDANDELRRAQAILVHQEKMSALGQLVTGIAHELNNPISFVYGNIDFMAEYLESLLGFVRTVKELPELTAAARAEIARLTEEMEFDYLEADTVKLLGSIRTGAERSAAIVRDLKLFSRTQPDVMEPSDLQAGIEATLTLLQPLLRDRVQILRDYEPLPRVRCDFGHINQVFMNILTNAAGAIDGHGDGHGEILIRTRRRGDTVRILFRDTGPGIAYEHLTRIFEPFFTTKPVGEGTGMGLAICDTIVRQHHGQLLVETTPGHGATFILELPVA
jgi:signal transduction histidine kinase